MSVVDAITITSVSTVNQITITSTSGISITTVGTQGLAGPSSIMGKAVDVTNTAGASDNGAVLIYNNGTSTWTASTLNTSQLITQNLYNLRLNGANVVANAILDEDNMASNSATALVTQQSIKSYVDAQVTLQDLDITDGTNTIDIDLDSETLGLLGGNGISSTASGTGVTFAIDATVVTLTGTQTLTNKTLTSAALTTPILNTSISGSAFLDEDDFASNSANKVASQQSIKAYVDTKLTAEDLDVTDGSTTGAIDLDSEVLGLLGGTGLTSSLSGNNFTFAIDNTVATLTGTQTFTNKTLTQPKLNGSVAITTTGTEINVLDGNTSGSSVVLVDADRFIVNDNGTMKQIAVTRLDTYISGTTATLTNKTLTSPVINTAISGSAFLDEDNMASNSATKVASQQSIKAYVDANITAQDLDVSDGTNDIAIDLDSETLSLLGGTGLDSSASGNGVTFAIDNTVATLVGTQTLTNKTIDVDNNTVSNIELDNLKSGVLDTDLSSVAATDTTVASAKAIKTYVDANITAQDLDISDGSTTIAIDLDSETLSLLGGTGVTSAASGNGVTFAIGQSVGTGDNVQFNQVTSALVGNASTSTILQTARTIGGVSFDGSANINLAGVNTSGNQDTSGNAATATALATGRTIALSGDVTASGVSFDGTGNISLSTTIAANSVALGTDTTGNFVAGISGTNNEIEVSGSGSEGSTVTVGLPDNVIISGNLTVNGTTTTTDTNELHVTDPLIKLAKDNTSNSLDIGFYGQYRASGSNNQFAGLFRDQNDAGKFKLFELLQNEPTTTVNTSGTGFQIATLVANFEGNITGNVTGNTSGTAATVTGAAQTNITSVGTLTALQVDNININGNTISSTAGTDLNLTPLSGQQIVLDGAIVIDAGVVTGATSITSTAFVGGLTGDVTGNISGNSGTATILANNRNFSIAGDITASAIAFNGSGNVALSASIDDNVVGAAQLNISGNGVAGQAILSDGDGSFSYGDASKTTEQIQDIVGGMVTGNTETGITVTYEDGDGTLDFVINPAQTTITSLLATDIKIGEDDQTKIDFETADEIHFYVANAQQIKLVDGAIVPITDNDIDLGTSSLEFKNAFFDGTVTSDAFAGPLTGEVTGNASTATILATARTIGGTSFDGSANIAVALANTATTLATARTIGGVSFDGSANINLAGVNTTGNQDTSGNAATATALATARTIGGTSFNGTANIAIALANTATTLATARTINGVSFNGSANITTLTAGTGVSVSGTAVSIGQAVATSSSPTFSNMTLSGTDSIKVPAGTTGQRNGSPANGMFRYNNTNEEFEGYQNGAWGAIAGGGAAAMETSNHTGDGSERAFSISTNVVNEDNLVIFIDGVYQNKATFVASGTTVTFDTAPANTRKIVIYHVRSAVAGSSIVQDNFTGNGSTTAYTLSINPTSELNTQVFIDGVYQSKTTYAVSGTTLTFDAAPVNTTAIEVIIMSQTAVNVPTSNSITTSMIQDSNITTSKILNANVTTAKIADDAITSAKLDTNISVAGTLASTGVLTANAGVVVDNFTLDGTTLALSSGDLTLDVAGDIILDADGGDILFKDAGSLIGFLSMASSNLNLTNNASDGDIIFTGNDGGVGVTALTLDMSAAGAATFNSTIASGKVAITGGTATSEASHVTFTNTQGAKVFAVGGGQSGVTNNGFVIRNVTDNTFPLVISDAGAATFSGTITSGAITTSGDITLPSSGQINASGALYLDSDITHFRLNNETELMRIQSSGVGIGTNSPSTPLHVKSSTAGTTVATFEGNYSANGDVKLASFERQGGAVAAAIEYNDATTDMELGTTTSHSFSLKTADTRRLTIDSSGAATFNSTITSGSITSSGVVKASTTFQTSSGSMLFYVPNVGEAMRIEQNTGNVGIGDASPDNKLHVNSGTSNVVAKFESTDSIAAIQFKDNNGEAEIGNVGNDLGFFPAGVEKMRLDSSGNLGIGRTSPSGRIHTQVPSGSVNKLIMQAGDTSADVQINFGDTGSQRQGSITYANGSDRMEFMTDGSERMRILSSGQVKIHTPITNDFFGLSLQYNSNDTADFKVNQATGQIKIGGSATGYYPTFWSNNTERMRIDSSGQLFLGKTSGVSGAFFQVAGDASNQSIRMENAYGTGTAQLITNTSGQTFNAILFENSGVSGSISVTTSSTAYNTSSDARLKDVTGEARGLEVINELNPVAYNWKADGKADEGLIAQEVMDIVPNAVTGSEEDMYQMDYSKLVVHLVAGMKEQQTQIETLKAEIEELKSNG